MPAPPGREYALRLPHHLVVLFHATEANHIPALQAAMPGWLVSIVEHGHLGVPIFFVISGFVIALSLDGKPIRAPMVARFMLRRSIRLDPPPYWGVIIIAILFSLLASVIVKDRQVETFSVGQIVAHLFCAQDLLRYQNIIGVFWTLCLEVQFYLVYALLLATRSRCDSISYRRSDALAALHWTRPMAWPISSALARFSIGGWYLLGFAQKNAYVSVRSVRCHNQCQRDHLRKQFLSSLRGNRHSYLRCGVYQPFALIIKLGLGSGTRRHFIFIVPNT
jgi:peptidoglycan/LPS O-acetylase OafA/YrhL